MKIAVVVDSLNFGGAERQAVELARGLASRHEVHMVTFRASQQGFGPLARQEQLPVHEFPRRSKADVLPLFRAVALFRKQRFDVAHTFMNVGSLLGLAAARAAGTPVVSSPFRDAHPGKLRSESIKRFVARHSDICVANSRAGFDARYATWRENFRVVYNGFDLARFDAHVAAPSEELKHELTGGRFDRLVGIVGRLSLHKDHAGFLELARRLQGAHPRCGFLIVGDGPTRPALEALAAGLGVTDRVVFAGYRSDVDRIYPLLDVAVLLTDPVHAAEGTPNAVIEPMACGVPVVATNHGGTPETLTHGAEGFLVPPGDVGAAAEAVGSLLDDPGRAAAMGRRGQETAHARFSLARYVSDCENLYHEVLGRDGNRA